VITVSGTAASSTRVQAGDLVQFRDYEFTRREQVSDGSWREYSEVHSLQRQHDALGQDNPCRVNMI